MSFRMKFNQFYEKFVIVKAIFTSKDMMSLKKMTEKDRKKFLEFLKEKCPSEYN